MRTRPVTRGHYVTFVMALLLPTLASSGQSFTRVTEGEIVTDRAQSLGASWIDFDLDGDLDLFVSNGNLVSQPNNLYRNDGGGVFTAVTGGAIVTDRAISNGSIWGDYDEDGDPDVLVISRIQPGVVSGRNLFYENNGDGTFTRDDSTILFADQGNSNSGSTLDIDNDGDLDLFVLNFNDTNLHYRNDGAGAFSQITVGAEVSNSFSIGGYWADYDQDDDLDLYVANGGGRANALYQNQGDGSFVRVTAGDFVNDTNNSLGASWGDFDNDGDLDLFVANFLEQNNSLYRNNGDGTFDTVVAGPLVNDGGRSVGSAWGDVDNDGDLDLLVTNDGGSNFLYENDGSGQFTRRTSGAFVEDTAPSFGVTIADFDADGDVDVFVANRNGSTNGLFTGDGNANHWLNVRLTSTVSNPAAIGGRIRVLTSINGQPVWQMREIVSQSGYNAQGSLRAAFGLGDATLVDSVLVEWPSGVADTYGDIAADQFFVSVEGETVSSVRNEADRELPAAFTSQPNYPDPFHTRTFLSFELAGSGVVNIQVFDVMGRRLLEPVSSVYYAAGRHEVSIGADELPGSGLYLYRVAVSSGARGGRLQAVRFGAMTLVR